MTRLAPLLLLLAACSSSGPDDPETLEDGSSGEVDPGGTGDDGLDEGGSSEAGESGESGEPAPAWPPACLDEGTCGVLEGLTDAAACEDLGLRVEGIELLWGYDDLGTGGAVSGRVVGECGDPLRWVYDDAVWISAYSLGLTWAGEGGVWQCTDLRSYDSVEVQLGEMGQLEMTGPYIHPAGSLGEGRCCQVKGAPVDGIVSTPCG